MSYSKFNKFLAVDCETSSMSFGIDPSTNCQMVSIGLIVSDTKTYEELDTLYLEIKWNGESDWSQKAESIHQLSKEYLEENGVDEEEAAVQITEFIMKHFNVSKGITLLGHNVSSFDRFFLRSLLMKFDIDLKFSHRNIDSFTLGLIVLDAYDSDELFRALGYKYRDGHNALEDIRYTLSAVRWMHNIIQEKLYAE